MTNLDSDQKNALSAFKEGRNIAVFGGGGCGKSVAEEKYGSFPTVASCALTAHAADFVRGRTIHSLFGAPPYWPFTPHLWEMIKTKPGLLQILSSIKVLLIDEVTLLSDRILDTLDVVMRNTAKTNGMASLPFGGRQIVLAGDPFQLGAIIDSSTIDPVPISSLNAFVQLNIAAHN